ncbi:hypothetical protein VTN77DRAFT_5988 [Rasamsonia byssochlamydoides]|uniref:uncharacterized protein n=1 Tax=Rasamsonia byssochlamydoides TaxID=89139 RepID=UPI003743AF7A
MQETSNQLNEGRQQHNQQHHHHHNHPHLPGHPLHTSYAYKYVPLTSLRPDTPAPSSSSSDSEHEHEHKHEKERHKSSTDKANDNNQNHHDTRTADTKEPIWILDARGSHDKEDFARAWCAAAGTSAVIGRVGRTCLACCVREARAIDVGVVIRVG